MNRTQFFTIFFFASALLLNACKNTDTKNNAGNTTTVTTTAEVSQNSIYEMIGDSMVIPTFDIEVKLSDKAAALLKKKKETVVVDAFLSGFLKDKTAKEYDPEGSALIANKKIEQNVTNNVVMAHFEGIKFSKMLYENLEDKDVSLLINVYSGRKSSDNNLLDSEIVEEKASNFKNKKYILQCKLIGEK